MFLEHHISSHKSPSIITTVSTTTASRPLPSLRVRLNCCTYLWLAIIIKPALRAPPGPPASRRVEGGVPRQGPTFHLFDIKHLEIVIVTEKKRRLVYAVYVHV